MKKAVKRLLVLFLALTFIVTDLAVAPVTAQAAGTLKFHKTIALMKGEGNRIWNHKLRQIRQSSGTEIQ